MDLKHHVQKLEKRTAEIIYTHRSYPPVSMATLLHGGSLLYEAGVKIRNMLYEGGRFSVGRVDRPVVSVGNLTTGGTGKTPMTLYLAKILRSCDLKVLIVSRGYKSKSEKVGAVVSDGKKLLCDARGAGDEPYLMARLLESVPVMVGRDRMTTIQSGIRRFSPDIVLLDDAFQHQRLARDLNLVLMDARDPVGNGHLLPRGPLREPISALARADAIIFTRCRIASDAKPHLKLARIISGKPVFRCNHKTVLRFVLPAFESIRTPPGNGGNRHPNDCVATIGDRKLYAFSALAKNDAFVSAIRDMGAEIRGRADFPDHHFYDQDEIAAVIHSARKAGCDAVVTTDKDYVRLPMDASFPIDFIVLGAEIDFGQDAGRWQQFIWDRLVIG